MFLSSTGMVELSITKTDNTDGFDAKTCRELFEIEDRHFWHVGRKRIILDALRRNVPRLAKIRMLEIGCGNGNVMAYLRQNGIDVEGGDLSVDGLEYCRQRMGDVPLHRIGILSLPFHNEFDIIGAFDVLEHVKNDERALTEVKWALKPKGSIVLTVPAHKFLWSYFDEEAGHKRRYSKSEITTKLERAGFTVKRISFFMFFLLPILSLVRITHRHSKAPESKVVPVINDIFLALLTVERWLMRYMNLPTGSSLLVIAEKRGETP